MVGDVQHDPPTDTDNSLSAMAGEKCIDMILAGDFGKCAVFRPAPDFYEMDAAPLEQVARQWMFEGTAYFDYRSLQTTPAFIRDYGNLFRASLGSPSCRDSLVYRKWCNHDCSCHPCWRCLWVLNRSDADTSHGLLLEVCLRTPPTALQAQPEAVVSGMVFDQRVNRCCMDIHFCQGFLDSTGEDLHMPQR